MGNGPQAHLCTLLRALWGAGAAGFFAAGGEGVKCVNGGWPRGANFRFRLKKLPFRLKYTFSRGYRSRYARRGADGVFVNAIPGRKGRGGFVTATPEETRGYRHV